MKKVLKKTFLGLFAIVFVCSLVFTTIYINRIKDYNETDDLNYIRENGNAHKLEFINAYGNNSAYHPTVQAFENSWNGYKYWMAYTPYPNGDDSKENPHITVSNDLENWTTPQGFTNPLEPIPENYVKGKIYNSDTELVYNTETGELECWWRFVDDINRQIIIYRKTTKDGVNWSERQIILKEKRGERDYISPALIYENNTYRMWYVDSPYSVYYIESKDLISWTEPVNIAIKYDEPRLRSWHLDVVHNNGIYEMVINAFLEGNNRRTMNLYYLSSEDNVNWTKAETMLKPLKGTKSWDNKGIYRSSLLYTKQNECYLFYSAIGTKSVEGVGIIKLK